MENKRNHRVNTKRREHASEWTRSWKRLRKVGEKQLSRITAESGSSLMKLEWQVDSRRGKKAGRTPATTATEVESGQPQIQPVDQTDGMTRSADYLNFLAEAEMKAVEPEQSLDMDDSEADDLEDIPGRVAAVLTGSPETEVKAERRKCRRNSTRYSRCPKAAPPLRIRQVTAPPCERGKISQWVLPRCSGRPRPAWAGRSTGGHVWARLFLQCSTEGKPSASALTAPAPKRHK